MLGINELAIQKAVLGRKKTGIEGCYSQAISKRFHGTNLLVKSNLSKPVIPFVTLLRTMQINN